MVSEASEAAGASAHDSRRTAARWRLIQLPVVPALVPVRRHGGPQVPLLVQQALTGLGAGNRTSPAAHRHSSGLRLLGWVAPRRISRRQHMMSLLQSGSWIQPGRVPLKRRRWLRGA